MLRDADYLLTTHIHTTLFLRLRTKTLDPLHRQKLPTIQFTIACSASNQEGVF